MFLPSVTSIVAALLVVNAGLLLGRFAQGTDEPVWSLGWQVPHVAMLIPFAIWVWQGDRRLVGLALAALTSLFIWLIVWNGDFAGIHPHRWPLVYRNPLASHAGRIAMMLPLSIPTTLVLGWMLRQRLDRRDSYEKTQSKPLTVLEVLALVGLIAVMMGVLRWHHTVGPYRGGWLPRMWDEIFITLWHADWLSPTILVAGVCAVHFLGQAWWRVGPWWVLAAGVCLLRLLWNPDLLPGHTPFGLAILVGTRTGLAMAYTFLVLMTLALLRRLMQKSPLGKNVRSDALPVTPSQIDSEI
jgi:hypothetical protein